jgi:hypothetical protein
LAEKLFVGVVTRALADRAFRDGLFSNPQKTLANAGFVVTHDQLNTIVMAKPGEWGTLTLDNIIVRIDTLSEMIGGASLFARRGRRSPQPKSCHQDTRLGLQRSLLAPVFGSARPGR